MKPLFPEVVVDFTQSNGMTWDMIVQCFDAAKNAGVPLENLREFMLETDGCITVVDVFKVCNKWFTIR